MSKTFGSGGILKDSPRKNATSLRINPSHTHGTPVDGSSYLLHGQLSHLNGAHHSETKVTFNETKDIVRWMEVKRPTAAEKMCWYTGSNIFTVLFALGFGIGIGVVLRSIKPSLTKMQLMYLGAPGEFLVNILNLVTIPFMITSLISGITALKTRYVAKIGVIAVVYYMGTTVFASITGILLVTFIRPVGTEEPLRQLHPTEHDWAEIVMNLIRLLFPPNLIEACVHRRVYTYSYLYKNATEEERNMTDTNQTLISSWSRKKMLEDGPNLLGLVTFAIVLSLAIHKLGEYGEPIKDAINGLAEAILGLVNDLLWYAPFGVLFLLITKVIVIEDAYRVFVEYGTYLLVILLGLGLHGFVTLPLIYMMAVARSPFKFLKGVVPAITTALGTASSIATLPVTMRNLQENNLVDRRVVSVIAPMGATLNMDGLAVYISICVMFVAQLHGIDITYDQYIIICFTSVVAAIAAAGVPQSGIIALTFSLTTLNYPTDSLGFLISVDWIVDRFCTVINVLGDAFGAGIIDKSATKRLVQGKKENCGGGIYPVICPPVEKGQSPSNYTSDDSII